jgi:hypothetical protein
MRLAPRFVSSFAALLIFISVVANLGVAVGKWTVLDFNPALRFPGIIAWVKAQLPFIHWLRPAGQFALSAATDESLPRMTVSLPEGTTVTTTGGRMIFAQMADGPFGSGKFFCTSFMLVNDSEQKATGSIAFYNNSGQPLTLTLNGVAASSFPFTLLKGAQRRFTTSGGGDWKVGWAMMLADQPVTGTCAFQILDDTQKVYGDVGVSESVLGTKFTVFADSIGTGVDTGLALVNPSATDINNLLLQLFDPSGKKLAEAPLTLNPMEHTARYLTEFFSNVANIQEFEGTIVITSMDNRKFGGLTLRLTGDLMTSFPMVVPPPDISAKDRLYFPQVADGLLGSLRIVSTILLFNNTTAVSTGTVEFFNSDSTPMNVTIGKVKASIFPFSLNPGGVVRMLTSGEGSARVGWALVKMDQPLSGAAMYQNMNEAGVLLAEVGVASAAISTSFNVIADSIGAFDTAIAVANPSEIGAPANVYVSLQNTSGRTVASTSFSLDAEKQRALYMKELFPNYKGIDEFEGRMRIDGGNPIIPLTLRMIAEKMTSVPVLRLTRGFAPTGLIEPAQNLAGSKPALRWQISQPIGDLAINAIHVSAPALGLTPGNLQVGDELGSGIFILDVDGSQQGGAVCLTVTSMTDGIGFQIFSDSVLLQGTQLGALQMSGKITGNSAGGLTIDMSGGLLPRTTNGGVGISMDFFLRSDLFVAPATAGTISLTSNYESSSTKIDEPDAPIRVQIVQPSTFVAPDAVKANLTSISSLLPEPKTRVSLRGINFGSQPKVYFTPTGGSQHEVIPSSVSTTDIGVMMPRGMGDGIIQVDNGQGIGNACYFRSVFAPALDVKPLATGNPVPISFTFNLGAAQHMINSYIVTILNADRTLSGFTAGTPVGTVTTTGGSKATYSTSYSISVVSSAADKLVLDVSGNNTQLLTIQKVQGPPAGLTFTYAYTTTWSAPIVNAFPITSEIKMTGLPIEVSVGGQATTWGAEICSAPYGFAGPNYFFRVIYP